MSVVVSVRTVVVFGDYWRRNYACRTTVVFILFTYIDCVQPVFFLFYRHREMFDSSLLKSQFLYSFLHNTLDVFSQ